MLDLPRPGYLTVSSPDLLLSVKRLAFLQHVTEVSIALFLGGMIAAAALFRTPGHSALAGGALLTAGLVVLRALVLAGVRQRTGPHPVALHASGGWLVVEPAPGDPALGLSFDLRRRALPAGPLLWPGAALAVLLLVAQLLGQVPRAAADSPWTDAPATLVAALLLLHQAAAAALHHAPTHGRFRSVLPWLLLVLALVALLRRVHDTSPMSEWALPLVRDWPTFVWTLCPLWLAGWALAAARADRVLVASLAGLMALALVGGSSPHVWAVIAVASALAPRRTAGSRSDERRDAQASP